MDLTKLDVRSRMLAVIGVLAFINSFLPWYSVSEKMPYPGATYGFSSSGDAWGVGIGGWLPMLLLLAVGVVVALPAVGREVAVPGGWVAFGAVGILATLIVLLRWLTYPSVPAGESPFISAGAAFGTYLGLLLTLGTVVVAYLGFTAGGGKLDELVSGLRGPTATPPSATPPAGNPQDGAQS